MNRIDRLTAILIQLQSKRVVKAQEIADRFNISLRTVYRDVRALEEAGLPLVGEAGVGYSIMDGYRLPPVHFSREEALALMTAEKLVGKFTDQQTKTSHASALYKIRAVLRSAEKNMLENVEERIEVFHTHEVFQPGSDDDTLQSALQGIAGKNVLTIEYTAFHSAETTLRDIEPVGVFYAAGHWHLVAYCRLRKDYRDFRADRINKMIRKEEQFTTQHPALKTYLETLAQKQQLTKVVINVERNTVPYLGQQKLLFGFVSEQSLKDKVQLTFLSASPETFIRWYAMFADRAEIVEPESLHDLLEAHIRRISKKN